MIYYLTCFSFSSFLLWFGQKVKYEQSWFVYGIALLIPAVLAGIRDVSVGTDVLVYAYPIFENARAAQYMSDLSNAWDRIEIGYLWLNFALSRITYSHNVLLFSLMFIQVLFVFLTLRQWKNKIPIWLGMFVFYALFFNASLNLMRQCLALSIAFFGMKYIFKKKFFLFVFWILLGSLFHRSALIIALYYPLFWYANQFSSKKSTILFATIFLSLIVFSEQIATFFIGPISSIIPYAERILYFTQYIEKEGFPYNTIMFYSVLTILFLCRQKIILSDFPNIGHFLKIVIIIAAIIPLFVVVGGKHAYRFFPFVHWWLCFFIPIIFYSFNKIFSRPIINGMAISYCLFYWYVTYIYFDRSETAEYLTIFNNAAIF